MRTFERREATIEHQLEIAEVALCEGESREGLGLGCQLRLAGEIAGEEVLEDSAVGCERHIVGGCSFRLLVGEGEREGFRRRGGCCF